MPNERTGAYARAREHLSAALVLAERMQSGVALIRIRLAQARLATEEGSRDDALGYLNQALVVARRIGSRSQERNVLGLMEAWADTGEN